MDLEIKEEQQPKEVYDESPSLTKALIGFVTGFVGYMYLLPMAILMILMVVLGLDLKNADPATQNYYSLLSQVIAGAICLACMIFVISKDKIGNILKNFNTESVRLGITYFIASYGLAVVWNIISTLIWGPVSDNANQESINIMMKQSPLLTISLTCIVAPLIEEFIFRYYMYKGLETKFKPVVAIALTAFLFAFIHMFASIQSGTFVEDLKTLPGYLLPSLVFTYAYYKHQKFAIPYIAHLSNNVFATIMFFIASNSGEISSTTETIFKCLIG